MNLGSDRQYRYIVSGLLIFSCVAILAAAWGVAWQISKMKQAGVWPWVPTLAGEAAPACETALAIAKSSPQVQAALGEPIREGGRPVGSARRGRNSGFAEWTDELSGPGGKGRLCAVANRIGETWSYSRLVFYPANGNTAVDLTPAPERETHVPPSDAKVYLVPLDLSSEYSLDWASAYYRAKLDIDVEVLLEIPVEDWVIDPSRHQAVAERLISLMTQSEKEIARDPSATILGVTQRDMYIGRYDWRFAVNYRTGGRLGVVSLARVNPALADPNANRLLLAARLEKLLTKNILVLAFHLPQSDDPSSVLYLTMNAGPDLDLMSESIVGGQGRWISASGDPTVTVAVAAGKPEEWGIYSVQKPPPDTLSEVFETDIVEGLFIQRRTDFYEGGSAPFQFVRVFRTKDNASRAFGVGANDSLDIFLVGEMGSWIDLLDEAGSRIHFRRDSRKIAMVDQAYTSEEGSSVFFNPRLEYASSIWHLRTSDGWSYVFPYRPDWPGTKVTTLTNYLSPDGRIYSMTRDSAGNLLSLQTPSGYSLTFLCDSSGRYQKISDSRGRSVEYRYDPLGRLVRFADSSGNQESYTYDGANHLLLVLDGDGRQILKNEYDGDDVVRQTLSDGRQLKYRYDRHPADALSKCVFTDANGFITTFNFNKQQFSQSLPEASAN